MLEEKKVVVLIPLRGGSKSIKNKNLASLGEKPLLAWPIEVAKQVPEVDQIIVSTDSDIIAEVARHHGADIQRRPPYLATDEALVADVIRYCRDELNSKEPYHYMVLLEATSPFRDVDMVQRCLYRLHSENLDSIATFHESDTNPHRTWKILHGRPVPFIDGAIPWLSRQKLPVAYQLNGAVYAFNLQKFPTTGPSVLFGRVGAEIINGDGVIDIDTNKHLVMANALLQT